MKRIFWNVDTQEDFMSETGALYVPGAESIKPTLSQLTQYARLHDNIKIVNTADLHYPTAEEISDSPDFVNTFPPHCLRGTPGAEFIKETKPGFDLRTTYTLDWEARIFDAARVRMASSVVLYKDHFDIFQGNPYAEKVVDALRGSDFTVYGVAANVCVDYAVMGLLARGKTVSVVTDATKAIPEEALTESFKKWEAAGARLTTLEEVLGRTG